MVTAEFSFAIIGIALLLVFFGWLAALGLLWLKCENVAYLLAKDYSRNDLAAVAKTKDSLSKDFGIGITESSEGITVQVSTQSKSMGVLLPTVTIQAQAHAKR